MEVTKTKLVGTTDISPSGKENLSMSYDENWLFYPATLNNAKPEYPNHKLYNTKNNSKLDLSFTKESEKLIKDFRGPLNIDSGCFDDEGVKVYLATDNLLYYVDTSKTTSFALLEVIENPNKTLVEKYYNCDKSISNNFEVKTNTDKNVSIVDRNTKKVLVNHKSYNPLRSRLTIENLNLSPDLKWLSYELTAYSGSFVGPSEIYILDLTNPDSTPKKIAKNTYGPIKWLKDSNSIYVVMKDLGEKTPSIYKINVKE